MSRPATVAGVADPAGPSNPFVGPRSLHYGEAIHGRTREIHDLASLLVAQRIVLLYSPSGAGKSSLLEAGLRPELERREFELFRTIRVGFDLPDATEVRNRYLHSALLSLEEGRPREARLSASRLAEVTLDDYLGELFADRPADREPCLIFDQFEELVTLDPSDQPAKEAFVSELGVALRDRGRWALLSMREDFIAQLDPYLHLVPTRLAARYRLDLLGPRAAREAAQRTAADASVRFGDDAADVLVDDLRRVRVQRGTTTSEELGTSVEPVQLQVVCRQLWSTLDAGAERIEVDDVAALGRVDDALADFYVQQVRAVAERTGTTERELRTWFDEALISDTGFRAQVLQGPGPNGVAVLRELENAHLIRAERRRGTEWYELSHDRLIDPIRTSNAAWREQHLSPLQRESQVWDRRGRPDGLLLTGVTLAEAETWAEQHPSELLPGDEQFLSASRVERRRAELERRASRRRLTAAAGVGVIALAALAVVTVLLGRTKRAEDHAEKERQAAVHQAEAAEAAEANAAELATRARAGELAFLASIEPDPFVGLGLSLQAELQPEALIPETRAAYARAIQRLAESRLVAPPMTAAAATGPPLLWSGDGHRLGTVSWSGGEIFDVHEGDAVSSVAVSSVAVATNAWSHDLSRLASLTGETLQIREATSGRVVVEATEPVDPVAGTLAWSPDDSRVAVSYPDGTFTIWAADGTAGSTSHTRETDPTLRSQSSLAWSPDGSYLAAQDRDGFIHLWSTTTATELAVIGAPKRLPELSHPSYAWSPDGTRIATGSFDGRVDLWGLGGEPLGELEGDPVSRDDQIDHALPAPVWSPDGTRIARARPDGPIVIWDLASALAGVDRLEGHTDSVHTIEWLSGGARLVSGGYDGTIRLWDPATKAQLDEVATESVTLASSPDGAWQAVLAPDAVIRVFELRAGPLTGHEGSILSLTWSPDGSRLASTATDLTTRVWDTATGTQADALVASTGPGGGWPPIPAWSPDGRRVATVGADGSVEIRDASASTASPTVIGQAEPVVAIQWSPDSTRVAVVSDDSSLRIWDPTTAEQLGNTITAPGLSHRERPGEDGSSSSLLQLDPAFGWSPDGTLIATGQSMGADQSQAIHFWDARTGMESGEPVIGEGALEGSVLAWSPDGTRIASAAPDGGIQIADPATRKVTSTFEGKGPSGLSTLAWSPDGKLLATADYSGTRRVWDPETGAQVGDAMDGGTYVGESFSWSPDGALLAVGNDDGSFAIRDVETGLDLGDRLPVHNDPVTSIAWSPDGSRIATGDEDGSIRMWVAISESDACQILAGRTLAAQMEEKIGGDFVCADPTSARDLPLLPLVPWVPPSA